MPDNTITVTETTAGRPDNTPTAAAAQPAIDMSAIEAKAQERAGRAATGVVKSMLEQQGLDSKAIQDMLADWKSKQVTPEQATKALQDELEAERLKTQEATQKYAVLQQDMAMQAANIPPKEQAYYREKISALAKEKGIDFTTAITEYILTDPVVVRPAPGALSSSGVFASKSSALTEKEQILATAQKAMGVRPPTK